MKLTQYGLAAALLATLALAGCSTSSPTDTPGVERLGEYILRQPGPELDLVLGYRFASSNVADDWLILEVAMSTPQGETTKVQREDVFVRTPAGDTIPMASQSEFGSEYRDMRATLKKADVARDPMGYFPPSRLPCRTQFFTVPGEGVSFDELTVNDRRVCEGRLFFKVPGGVQTGRWTFGIDLEESDIRIPFQISGE